MVHFIETFHQSRILEMKANWLVDDLDHVLFMNIIKLRHAYSKREYITTETFLKK